MPVKIRLQRRGKKGKPFFWIVAADARAKRDGKFLEKLGIYNPTTNPSGTFTKSCLFILSIEAIKSSFTGIKTCFP